MGSALHGEKKIFKGTNLGLSVVGAPVGMFVSFHFNCSEHHGKPRIVLQKPVSSQKKKGETSL